MSYDRYSIEYRLTVNGWSSEDADCPSGDHVETWEKQVHQGSEFGRESAHWRRLWSNPSFTEEQLAELHEQFPFPERGKTTADLFKNIVQ
jgi:hypothetical protein